MRGWRSKAQLTRRFVQDQKGMSMIEYGVMAAFIVAALAALAFLAGPEIKVWMGTSMCSIMGKKYNAPSGGSGSGSGGSMCS